MSFSVQYYPKIMEEACENPVKEYEEVYTEALSDITVKEEHIKVVLLKNGKTFYRASRKDEVPFPHGFKQEIKRFAEEKIEDWSGRYFFVSLSPDDYHFPSIDDVKSNAKDSPDDNHFPSIDDVDSYATDYIDENSGKGVYLIEQREVKEELYAIVNKNRKHGTTTVTGDIKALALKDYFKKYGLGSEYENDEKLSKISERLKQTFSKKNGNLITVLDSFGLAYIGPHTEDQGDELILGHNTLDKTKPKKITQVLACGFDKQHESPDLFLKNTDFENSGKEHYTRRRFLLEHVKLAHPYPEMTLEAVTEMVKIATTNPSVVAEKVRLETAGGEHMSSQLAGVVARGGMASLAEAWISLLHLLYEKGYLSGKEVISALLPHKKQDRVKSLAQAIAGAAWSSKAATKLCALLSEIASSDEQLESIIERLSIKHSGYHFQQLMLDRYADFYKRAKHADKFSKNDAAKAQLKEGHLIPKKRELYKMVDAGTPAAGINWEFSFEALQEKIKDEITPQVKASYDKMKKEKAQLEQAKISAGEKLNEINAMEKEVKKIASDKMMASLEKHFLTQELLHTQSIKDKNLAWQLSQASNSQNTHTNAIKYLSIVMPMFVNTVPFSDAIESSSITSSITSPITSPITSSVDEHGIAELEQRLQSLKSFINEYETENLEQRLASLKAFTEEYETDKLTQRLANLRSEDRESKSKQLAPALRND